jgi:hypothetical protein
MYYTLSAHSDIDGGPLLGYLHRAAVGRVSDISVERSIFISTVELRLKACISETSITLPSLWLCKYQRAESTSTMNHRQIRKLIVPTFAKIAIQITDNLYEHVRDSWTHFKGKSAVAPRTFLTKPVETNEWHISYCV